MDSKIDREQSGGKISFNKYTRRYYFEGLSDKEIAKIYKKGFDLPLRVQWRITQLCNLKCKHCYLDKKNQKEKELKKEQLIKIAEEISSSRIFEVLITGGEPTVKEGLDEVVDILGKTCSIIIFTNALDRGSLKKLLPTLRKYKKNIAINVSLDGPKKIHDLIRGKGTYEKVASNIKLLTEEGFEVNTNTVLTTNVVPYLKDFVEEVKDLGMECIKFSKFYPLGEGKKYINLMPSSVEFRKIILGLLKLKRNPKCPRIAFDHNFCFLIDGSKREIDTRKCSGGLSKMVIEANGDVFSCQLLPFDEFKMGNIVSQSLPKIWDSKNRSKFITDFFPQECKVCKHNRHCNSGCKAASYSVHKTFKHKDPYCFYGKTKL
jgi:radical SAM protein with 4Fe4S-binding SPASM domain